MAMRFSGLDLDFEALPAELPIGRARVDASQWSSCARAVAAVGGRLVSMWGSDRRDRGAGFVAHAAYALLNGLAWVELSLDDPAAGWPDLSGNFPNAARLQRATADQHRGIQRSARGRVCLLPAREIDGCADANKQGGKNEATDNGQ